MTSVCGILAVERGLTAFLMKICPSIEMILTEVSETGKFESGEDLEII